MLVPFYCIEEACKSVSKVFSSGLNPSALEFMERDAIDWTIKYTDINMTIEDDVKAHLLIEFDGNDLEVLYNNCEEISKIMLDFKCGIFFLQIVKDKRTVMNLKKNRRP